MSWQSHKISILTLSHKKISANFKLRVQLSPMHKLPLGEKKRKIEERRNKKKKQQDKNIMLHRAAIKTLTRRPASADRTARRQFRATGQLVSRTQASGAMTSRLPRYEAKCVQRRCFQCGSVPLRSDIKGKKLPLPIY